MREELSECGCSGYKDRAANPHRSGIPLLDSTINSALNRRTVVEHIITLYYLMVWIG